jgi:hypothetical protein
MARLAQFFFLAMIVISIIVYWLRGETEEGTKNKIFLMNDIFRFEKNELLSIYNARELILIHE